MDTRALKSYMEKETCGKLLNAVILRGLRTGCTSRLDNTSNDHRFHYYPWMMLLFRNGFVDMCSHSSDHIVDNAMIL